MRRVHTPAEENLLKRRENLLKQVSPGYHPTISRKRHPLDCGNTRCGMCHFDKRFGHTKTWQEKRSELRLREEQEEQEVVWEDDWLEDLLPFWDQYDRYD